MNMRVIQIKRKKNGHTDRGKSKLNETYKDKIKE